MRESADYPVICLATLEALDGLAFDSASARPDATGIEPSDWAPHVIVEALAAQDAALAGDDDAIYALRCWVAERENFYRERADYEESGPNPYL